MVQQVCVEVDGERFVAAAAGEHHTLVVTQYGDVKAFGRGREGQLGHSEGSRLDTDVPGKVSSLRYGGMVYYSVRQYRKVRIGCVV